MRFDINEEKRKVHLQVKKLKDKAPLVVSCIYRPTLNGKQYFFKARIHFDAYTNDYTQGEIILTDGNKLIFLIGTLSENSNRIEQIKISFIYCVRRYIASCLRGRREIYSSRT